MTHNWTASELTYGDSLKINFTASSLAYNNGTYLIYSDDNFGTPDFFTTTDILNPKWVKVATPPDTNKSLKNVVLTSIDNYFLVVAVRKTLENTQLVAFKSQNGTEWEEVYHLDNYPSESAPVTITIVSGRLVVCDTGCIYFAYLDGTSWTKTSLPSGYENSIVLGAASYYGKIYFLMRTGEVSHVAITTDGIIFSVVEVPWNALSFAISDNGDQIVVSTRINNQCCLVYFSDDIMKYNAKKLQAHRVQPNEFSTVFDMIWADNKWVFVGSVEFQNVGNMTFSVSGFVYQSNGSLDIDTEIESDTINAIQLNRVIYDGTEFITYGKAFPNTEKCIYIS